MIRDERSERATRYHDSIIEMVCAHYDRTFRPPTTVRVGMRVWVDLVWYVAQLTRFLPRVSERPPDDYYCAYCRASLPKRRPAARCEQCGAPWTSLEDAAHVDANKEAIGFTSMQMHGPAGAFDVQCDVSLPGEGIQVE